MITDVLRNIIWRLMPARMAHGINVYKNIKMRLIEPELDALDKLLTCNPTKTALDVGANLGLHADYLSRRVENVIAFEPQQELVRYLEAVLAPNVRVIPYAASNAPGRSKLYIPKGNFILGSLSRLDALGTIETPNTTNYDCFDIETIAVDQEFMGKGIGLIKIDAEGHESKVIMGAIQTIISSRPIIYIEIDRHMNNNYKNIFDTLTPLGYTPYYYTNSKLRKFEHSDIPSLQSDAGFSELRNRKRPSGYFYNFLFIHDIHKIPSSLQETE